MGSVAHMLQLPCCCPMKIAVDNRWQDRPGGGARQLYLRNRLELDLVLRLFANPSSTPHCSFTDEETEVQWATRLDSDLMARARQKWA